MHQIRPDQIDITIFVPCYNEAQNIINTFSTITKAFASLNLQYEIIVIDDDSKDKTPFIVEEYIKSNPEIKIYLYKQPKNMGLAYNFAEAAFKGRGEYFRQVNGDNDETAETLITILNHIGKADIIIPYHQISTARSIPRRMLSNVYTKIINLINGYAIKYYNGLAIYPRELVMRWHSHSHGYGYQAELTTCILATGANFIEVPVTASNRVFGESKAITYSNLLSIMHTLIKLSLKRISTIYHRRLSGNVATSISRVEK